MLFLQCCAIRFLSASDRVETQRNEAEVGGESCSSFAGTCAAVTTSTIQHTGIKPPVLGVPPQIGGRKERRSFLLFHQTLRA